MKYSSDSLGLSGSVTPLLRDLIHEQLGLMYEPHQFDQVADRLAPLIVAHGLGSYTDYYYLLKYSAGPDEWLKVIDALAVQETYFWREIDQLRAVVTCVVPELVKSLNGMPLRIWSVPCCTGEEPLTIAMLLSEAGWFERAPIEIIASDASPSAIARARKGQYGERSFRNLPPALREKHFVERDGAWAVDPALRHRVSYDIVNLMAEDQVASHAAAPIVFCRNVFIYFSERSIRRALGVFERLMPSPGYLCVAAAESLLRRTTAFDLREIGGAFMYVRDASAEPLPAWAPRVGKAS
jgi:chemotaxis protein methyltransferase CheR